MTLPPERGAAGARWLIAGPFTSNPQGRVFSVTRNTLADTMVDAALHAHVDICDRLGNQTNRTIALAFPNPQAFKMTFVIENVPELAALRDLASDLGSASATQRPSPERAISRIVTAVGDGRLSEAVALHLSSARKKSADARDLTEEPSEQNAVIEKIFAKAEAKKSSGASPSVASSAVTSFVKGMRSDSQAANTSYKTDTPSAKKTRDTIEDAIFATASDILATPEVQAFESTWRGVKLVLDQTPPSGGVETLLLDTTFENMADALEAALGDDPIEWPDAFFLADPVEDVKRLNAIGELAESLNVPVLATTTASFLGHGSVAKAARNCDTALTTLGNTWTQLRASEHSRWLSLCVNRGVVFTEGAGIAKRTVFVSPAFVAAAMLTASYRDTGSFGRITGPTGALQAPATWLFSDGKATKSMIPTEEFLAITAQAELATLGVVGLGSGRNSDKITVSRWPMVRDNKDTVPLSAQIITGRIVRFSLWVRDQLEPGMTSEETNEVFKQAADVFLFAGLTGGYQLAAELIELEGQPAHVVVTAQVAAPLAGVPLSLAFPLPLR